MRVQRKRPEIEFDANGVAVGWAMAVKSCFRQQLDIRPTTYIRTRSLKDGLEPDADFLKKVAKELEVIDYHRVQMRKKNGRLPHGRRVSTHILIVVTLFTVSKGRKPNNCLYKL